MLTKIQRLSGVSAVAMLWFAVSVGMIKAGVGLVDTRPISFLGVASETALLFNSLFFLSAILFMIFGVYLYRTFNSNKWFLATFLIGQAAQVIAALFQYGGEDKLIHTVAAFTLAVAIPIYMMFFAFSIKKQPLRTIVFRYYYIELLFFTIGIGAFVFIKGISPLAEILPALPFHAWVLYLTLKK